MQLWKKVDIINSICLKEKFGEERWVFLRKIKKR